MQSNFENNKKGFYHGYDYVVMDESKWLGDDDYIDTIDNFDPKKDVIALSLKTMVNRLSSKCFFG